MVIGLNNIGTGGGGGIMPSSDNKIWLVKDGVLQNDVTLATKKNTPGYSSSKANYVTYENGFIRFDKPLNYTWANSAASIYFEGVNLYARMRFIVHARVRFIFQTSMIGNQNYSHFGLWNLATSTNYSTGFYDYGNLNPADESIHELIARCTNETSTVKIALSNNTCVSSSSLDNQYRLYIDIYDLWLEELDRVDFYIDGKEENTSISGGISSGWTNNGTPCADASKGYNYLYFYGDALRMLGTTNKIDLTDYNYLCVYTQNTAVISSGGMRIIVNQTQKDRTTGATVFTSSTAVENNFVRHVFDISSITGPAYIGIANASSITGYVSRIYIFK